MHVNALDLLELPGLTEVFNGLYDLEGLLVTGGGRYGDRGRRLWVSPLSG